VAAHVPGAAAVFILAAREVVMRGEVIEDFDQLH